MKESEKGYMEGFKVRKGEVEMSYSNLDMCHDMHMHVVHTIHENVHVHTQTHTH